jgi:23S rRNA (adenine2503-C2)-methyltransferase
MPINVRYPIASLLAAARRYCDGTGRRVFIEYLPLDGVNDAPADAPPGRACCATAAST